jgi:hypothetical protein
MPFRVAEAVALSAVFVLDFPLPRHPGVLWTEQCAKCTTLFDVIW